LNSRCTLAGGEELHGPDDVDLLHQRPAAGIVGGGDHAQMDHRVDVLGGDHLGDHRITDVGPNEAHISQVPARGHDIDADDAFDVRLRSDTAGKPAAEIPADPGDQDDTTHGQAFDAGFPRRLLARATPLDPRLLQQLAVLLLGHSLLALLDD